MRKDASQSTVVNIPRLSYYHGGHFQSLKFFNSDRVINLTPDYKVSSNNTESAKKIMKVGQTVSGFGIELETVTTEDMNSVILCNLLTMVFDKCFPDDLFKIEQDSTVCAECITQVMSMAFIRNHYKDFKAMFDDYFPSFGITTNNSACGMHVNISNTCFGSTEEQQVESIRKLGYLINKHYDLFKVLVNRVGSTHWCAQMSTDVDFWKNTPLEQFSSSHGNCYNMSHVIEGRIEVRLVGGQKNYACFRNTMETIFFLTGQMKKLSWKDLDNLVKVFKGCNSYVFDRLERAVNENKLSSDVFEAIRPSVKSVDFSLR